MDQIISFVQEQWYVVVAAVIALFIIFKLVKSVIKWVVILIIIAGVLIYGANYSSALKDASGKVLDYAKEEAVEVMLGEAHNAEYIENPDGSYTVKSNNVEINSEKDSDEVKITFKGQTFTFKLSDVIQNYINQAKSNQ